MKFKSILSFIIILFSVTNLFASFYPLGGGLWFSISGGIGYYDSEIITQEKNFVDENQIVLTNEDQSNSEAEIDYTYRTYNPNLTIQFQTSDEISIGLNFQNNIVTQKIENEGGIRAYNSEQLMNFNQFGPIISYWIHSENVNFVLSSSINYVFGELHRVPVLYNNLNRSLNEDPDFQLFMKMYNRDINLKGYGISLGAYLNMTWESGILGMLGVRLDYSSLSINDDIFEYINKTNILTVHITASIGYSTYVD